MKIESGTGIDFTDQKSEGNRGYARDWFFWVHSAFKSALDIHFYERKNAEKTAFMRDRRAQKLGYESLEQFQKELKAEKVLFMHCPEYQRIMTHMVKDAVEEQGNPSAFGFRDGDRFESRCGDWYVIVTRATPDKRIRKSSMDGCAPENGLIHGTVSFDTFQLRLDTRRTWTKASSSTCSQHEFAMLLRLGKNSTLSLARDVGTIDCQQMAGTQADLFN